MRAYDVLLSLEYEHLDVWKTSNGNIAVGYHAEIKNGAFLIAVYGVGDTFENACEDYLNKIRGKTLVFNACSDSRKEVVVLG